MTILTFNSTHLEKIFQEIGLYNPKGEFYKARQPKHAQISAYIEHMQAAFSRLSTKRPIILLDCCCGKSYLSFVLYHYVTTVLGRTLKIIGVDNNAMLIEQCQNSAKALGFEGMEFYHADLSTFEAPQAVDVTYSLHACDIATDLTISTGVRLDARYIFSVSCCQHTNRAKMSGHPLTSVTRYQPYKERLVDMVGDSMRALLLENAGYGVRVFEFVPAAQTPKNIMLRAVKNTAKKQEREQAMESYAHLVSTFGFAPALESML